MLSSSTLLSFHAGLLYFVVKLYIDKYNIFYVYHPAAFHGRQFLHKSAVNFVVLGAVLLQLSILFFSVVRLGMQACLGF